MYTVEELARLIGEAERYLWGKTVHGHKERRKLTAEYIINNNVAVCGSWVATPDEHEICATEFECSVCKECFCTSEMIDDDFMKTMKYCPNCGAKMNKEVFND